MISLGHELTKNAFIILPKSFYKILSPAQLRELRLGKIRNEFNFVRRTQWLKLKDIEKLQLKRLKAIVSYAYYNIPFYKRRFREVGITPYDINSLKDISKIPVLTKDVVKRNIKNMISPKSKFHCVQTTSGSSGKPLKIVFSEDSTKWQEAIYQRIFEWSGFDPGVDKIMGVMTPITMEMSSIGLRDVLFKGLKILMSNRLIWNPKTLNTKELLKIFIAIQKFEPKLFRAYPSLMKLLLDIKERFDLEFPKSLKYVYLGGETYPTKIIQNKMDVEVFHNYGTNEFGAVATDCKEHSGRHIHMENLLLEITKENEILSEGEEGEVVVTDFVNSDMPLIRYNIEDISVIESEKCSCGRGLIRLREVVGRKNDFLISTKGEVVNDTMGIFNIFTVHGEDFIEGVNQFRVIQNKINKIIVLIVPTSYFSSKTENLIVTGIKKLLGHDIEVKIKIVDNIPSGKKFKYVISDVNKKYFQKINFY